MKLPDFVVKAIYCFQRLNELGAKGTYMANRDLLSIVGTEQPLVSPVNDNDKQTPHY